MAVQNITSGPTFSKSIQAISSASKEVRQATHILDLAGSGLHERLTQLDDMGGGIVTIREDLSKLTAINTLVEKPAANYNKNHSVTDFDSHLKLATAGSLVAYYAIALSSQFGREINFRVAFKARMAMAMYCSGFCAALSQSPDLEITMKGSVCRVENFDPARRVAIVDRVNSVPEKLAPGTIGDLVSDCKKLVDEYFSTSEAKPDSLHSSDPP